MPEPKISALEAARLKFKPILPEVLKKGPRNVIAKTGQPSAPATDAEILRRIFPETYGLPFVKFVKGSNPSVSRKALKVGVVLSGGQAPGGHNVIAGLFDALKKANPRNKLTGFLGGPSGILENKWKDITAPFVNKYRNTGGFDMIQSGRTKIETPEQFETTKKVLTENRIDALVIAGGDDSNTNAALLAEYFKKENLPITVIGVPKTIDGDLKNDWVETSFGFDTTTKIYSELVGNICRDVNSARKYYHFIRLMGRSASHITLEVALQTHPNIALIGEEVLAGNMTLQEIVDSIADVIVKRASAGKNFGVVLVPEGLIEFIPEMKELISSLNDVLAANESALASITSVGEKKEFIYSKLPSPQLVSLMKSLPDLISSQLLIDRDPHGNVQVSQIETEKLLIDMIKAKLDGLKKSGAYNGKFSTITHFFGYEGRCGSPSNFDANYTYSLGYAAAILALNGLTGYIASVGNLTAVPSGWTAGGSPLVAMMNIEKRKGKEKPVIKKALVNLEGGPFKVFASRRDSWALDEEYIYPGPVQYFGPSSVTDAPTMTLIYEKKDRRR